MKQTRTISGLLRPNVLKSGISEKMTALATYIAAIEAALQKGDATEHTHRPALKSLVETFDRSLLATNEPKRISCGAPDLSVSIGDIILGYFEAKDVDVSLNDALRSPQLKRYLKSIDNLILTDYLEFRWFTSGELRASARIGRTLPYGKIEKTTDGFKDLEAIFSGFVDHRPQNISSPKTLAEKMARITHIIRDIIVTSFENEEASAWIRGWRKAFTDVLIADLDQPKRTSEFADMFAQTLSYGLFTARIMSNSGATFTRSEAQRLIPRTNPFLRNFFMDISNPRLDEEPFSSFVNDLVQLLAHTDMGEVLANFGRRTRQEDPIVHFYETFLAAYDPDLREKRGVYYTPEPVVGYIIRSVDEILKRDFDCQGLADYTEVTVKNLDSSLRVRGKESTVRKTTQSHKVLVLDPAVGTGTFLYGIVDYIRQQFIDTGNAGMWRGYVSRHLLPRLFGFEFMIAPYAVAHFKLSLQLQAHDMPQEERQQWAYEPSPEERIGIYLTNTLDEAHPETPMPLFTQYVAEESSAADEVKLHRPVLVVMGNPPYQGHSANRSKWIDNLQQGIVNSKDVPSYYIVDGQPLGERNSKWLKNDYVKFISFGQWRIARNGEGVLAFITDHGYIDNPTFRGMRQSLMSTFTEIFILDLHGGAKKKEKTPDGLADDNVFDIMQGVSIAIFVKRRGVSGPAKIQHADVWGTRNAKYEWLTSHSLSTTQWSELNPASPFYLFRPQDTTLLAAYNKGWKIIDIIPSNVLGFQSHRDSFAVSYDRYTLTRRIRDLLDERFTDEELRLRYSLRENAAWSIAATRAALRTRVDWEQNIIECDYRPFDRRMCYYSREIVDRPRRELTDHVVGRDNLMILASRQQATVGFRHVWAATCPPESCVVSSTTREQNYAFPLYKYPKDNTANLPIGEEVWPADPMCDFRMPNLNPRFIADLSAGIGLQFDPLLKQSPSATHYGPEEVFGYLYGIMHCPTYRQLFAEYLKLDFPRIPICNDPDQFRSICGMGKELIDLHAMRAAPQRSLQIRFPVSGNNDVAARYPKFEIDDNDDSGRVYINSDQYFDGVPPDVWDYYVGGFRVAEKWLLDRRGRELSFEELSQYQDALHAISRTIEVASDIDEIMSGWLMSLT